MTPEQARALEEYRRYVQQYADRDPELYQSQGNLILGEMGPSGMGDIVTDPRYRDAEMAALRELEDQSKNGFTASDLADIQRNETMANRANRGRIESIRQNMQARGMGGSGLDLVAQMQSAQDANETAALKALEREGMMQDRKSQATMNLGSMSSRLQGRDFEQAAAKARAEDEIKRFNMQNRNQAQQYNFQNRQNISNANQDLRNAQADKRYQAQTGMAQTNYNAATDDYNQAEMRKAERKRKQGGMMGGVLGAAGGVVGAVYGGPAGAAVGYQAGNALGQSAGNYAQGGKIPGDPIFPGDDEMNDIFTAEVSPGEVIIPRTIANDPVASAKFVAAQNQGMDPLASKYLATQDRYDQAPPMEAPRPKAPAPASKPKMAMAAKAAPPISDAALNALAAKNPSLVEQYRKKMGDADQAVKDAEGMQNMIGYGNVLGKGLTDFANSQKDNVILANRWDAMGKAPTVIEPERKEYDSTMADKLSQQGVDRAKEARNRADQEFFKERQIGQMDKQEQMDDPNSPESQSARAFLKSLLPNAAKIEGFDNFSASRLEKVSPMLMQKWQADRAQANADRDYALRGKMVDAKLKGANGKAKLNGEEQKRLDSAGMALAAVQGMRKALSNGDWTRKPIGDNDFTMWRKDFEEGLGRMQSGGAIGEKEAESFREMAPGPLDSAEMQYKKLAKLEREMSARIRGLGRDPEETLKERGMSEFPRQVRKGNKVATVNDQSELDEALDEGWM